MQQHRGTHALVYIPKNREKSGGMLQSGQLLHLRQVLVGETQGVRGRAVQPGVPVRVLILGNHLLPAAGVAGQRPAGQGVVRRDYAVLDQRSHTGQKPGGVATGVRHPLRRLDGLLLPLFQLRKAVHPIGMGAVGGGAVNHSGILVVDEGHRLHRGGVGQAEKDQISRVEEPSPLLCVLPLGRVDEEELNVLPLSQTVINLESCGTLLAVDVYLGPAHALASTNSSMRAICFSTLSRAGPP